MPSLCLFISFLISLCPPSLCATQHKQGNGIGGFLWQSASPWLGQACLLLAGSVEGKQGGREGGGEGDREGGREDLVGGRLEGWRRGLQLVMKSSLFILRRQSVSGRARGLRSSTAFCVCKVCRASVSSALRCLCVSAPVSHS